MVFVSFWTDNGYREAAERLGKSLDKFGLPKHIEQMEPGASQHKVLTLKPRWILGQVLRFRRPVIWLDADCEVLQLPSLLFTDFYDFAAYNWNADAGNPFHDTYNPDRAGVNSGVMLFNYTAPSLELLLRWDAALKKNLDMPDDIVLSQVLNSFRPPVRHLWLPRSYNRLESLFPDTQPIINHEYKAGGLHADAESSGKTPVPRNLLEAALQGRKSSFEENKYDD